MKFGLIGYPLGHSFSKGYFENKFLKEGLLDFTYNNFPIESIETVQPMLQSDVLGFNVTIPYKTTIIDYLDEVDDDAFKIGAVNTLVKLASGKWKGFNTDWSGFTESLTDWMRGQPIPSRALILGTGGASKAIQYALGQLNIPTATVSSHGNGDYLYGDLNYESIKNHSLIVNASPIGMMPDVDRAPLIPYEAITPLHWLYDLVYNPPNTVFLARGAQMGAQTKNGLGMLHLQAEHAWLIWKKYGRF